MPPTATPYPTKMRPRRWRLALVLLSTFYALLNASAIRAANPIITDVHTADPSALVYQGRVYLYAGQDEAPDNKSVYHLHKWLCYSSDDLSRVNEFERQ